MKKKLLMAVMAILMFSCSSHYKLVSYTVDYTKYSNKNFFMSEANSVSFEYTPIGSIEVQSISGTSTEKNIETQGNPYTFDKKTNYKFGSMEDAFKKLYETAIEKGANGVINIKFNSIYSSKDNNYESGYIVTGMMIKI